MDYHTNIIHLYEKNCEKAVSDSHRVMFFLIIAGKFLANISLNKITGYPVRRVTFESQHGFRKNGEITDMVFAILHLLHKCISQYQNLLLIFVDLTKALDTLS